MQPAPRGAARPAPWWMCQRRAERSYCTISITDTTSNTDTTANRSHSSSPPPPPPPRRRHRHPSALSSPLLLVVVRVRLGLRLRLHFNDPHLHMDSKREADPRHCSSLAAVVTSTLVHRPPTLPRSPTIGNELRSRATPFEVMPLPVLNKISLQNMNATCVTGARGGQLFHSLRRCSAVVEHSKAAITARQSSSSPLTAAGGCCQ